MNSENLLEVLWKSSSQEKAHSGLKKTLKNEQVEVLTRTHRGWHRQPNPSRKDAALRDLTAPRKADIRMGHVLLPKRGDHKISGGPEEQLPGCSNSYQPEYHKESSEVLKQLFLDTEKEGLPSKARYQWQQGNSLLIQKRRATFPLDCRLL